MAYEFDRNNIPQHIAIIMDGNGRWAEEHGKPRNYGHQEGVETVKRITRECVNLGVKYLTLYTFSTENWNRPATEVAALMALVFSALEDELFFKHNIRLLVVGDIDRLPPDVQQRVHDVEEHTAGQKAMTMVLALSYSSRWEITKAVKSIATEVAEGKLLPADICEDTVASHLPSHFMPDPDLLIRTGGEERISNFLLWQIAYSELYFADTYWPAFMVEDLHKAIADYQRRQRRFGKTEAQVEEEENVNKEEKK